MLHNTVSCPAQAYWGLPFTYTAKLYPWNQETVKIPAILQRPLLSEQPMHSAGHTVHALPAMFAGQLSKLTGRISYGFQSILSPLTTVQAPANRQLHCSHVSWAPHSKLSAPV